MIKIEGRTINEKTVSLKNIINFSFNADKYIPCDSLKFSCELENEADEFYEIDVFLDGNLIFDGIVDRQTVSITNTGRFISFECRNKTALMIDNEIKPRYYYRLSSEQLFLKFAKPFGIKGFDFPYPATKNFIQIKKGSSYFSMISEFCKLVYKKEPYITKDKIITLNPINQKLHIISNSNAKGIKYSSIKIKHLNDKIISKLYMKTAADYYGNSYDISFDNSYAQRKHVLRERYYNPTNTVDTFKENETKQILNENNRECFLIEITLPYLKNMNIGDCVRIADDKLKYDNLYISKMSYIISPTQGAITKLYLQDKKYA